MERLITEEQFEKVRIHMRDTYDVAEHEWDEEELIEAIYELIAKNNEVLDLVSKSFIAGDVVEITGWIHGHEFELGEKVTLIEKDDGLWVSKNKDGVQWYISEEEANVC
tara:strand:+ start:1205 stop:1531 length:327 start_codon:yes stop_codon:yes gene_type:complete